MNPLETPGQPSPLGANITAAGVNFSLFTRTASGVELLFFDRENDATPARVITLDPVTNRSYHYWHTFVAGVRSGQLYGYRVQGPFEPARGLRFDQAKVLLDPYGRGVVIPRNYAPEAARQPGDNASTAMKSVVVDPSAYDWEGDSPLRQPSARTRSITRPTVRKIVTDRTTTRAGTAASRGRPKIRRLRNYATGR